MAGRYDFISPGAAAGEALQKFLMQRELENRQRMLDAQAVAKQQSDIDYRNEELNLRRQTERRVEEERRAAQEDLANQREAQWAQNRVQNALPDQDVSGETRAKLARQGYEGAYNWNPPVPGVLMQGPQEGEAQGEEGRPSSPGAPGAYRMVGSPAWHLAREAAEERRAQAEALQVARDAQADETLQARIAMDAANRESRDMNAAGQRAIAGALTGLRGEQIQGQINAQQQKADDADTLVQRQYEGGVAAAQDTLNTLKRLATYDPKTKTATLTGAGENLFGVRVPGMLVSMAPGSDTATARADLNKLRGTAIVDLINEMKQQSKTGATGFGALSKPELQILQDKATILSDPNISDAAAAEAMAKIYELANKAAAAPPPARRSGGGGKPKQSWGRDAQGNPVLNK